MLIPRNVCRLLWEYDDAAVQDAAELSDTLLERVMTRGGISEMRRLLQTVDRHRLAAYLERCGWRVLPPCELRFWSRMAGIGEPLATEWVRKSRAREQSWR